LKICYDKPIMGKANTSKIDRKQKIVQAAIHCFIKQGVSQAKMNEIAAFAGVDQPLIHYYFPTLDSLYAEVIQQVLESLKQATIDAITKNPKDVVKTLEDYLRVPFQWAHKNPGLASIWLYFYHLASYNPTFLQMNNAIRENGRSRITVIIYSGMEKNIFSIPKGMTVNQVALNIQGLLTGNTIMSATENTGDWKKTAEETISAVMLWLKR
jgi:AcrR family transcriptional regulator